MLLAIGLALRARPLRQRRLRDFFFMSRPPLLYQEGSGAPNNSFAPSMTALQPAQIVMAVRQIAEAFAGDLEDGVADGRLNRSGAVMAHTEQPVPGLEETHVDFGRFF